MILQSQSIVSKAGNELFTLFLNTIQGSFNVFVDPKNSGSTVA